MSTYQAEGAGIGTPMSIEHFIPSGTLPGTDLADVFEGREHGNVPLSMFLVHNRPGDGPELHRHPYAEVFVVHAGQARFELEDALVTAGPGDVVIAPAGAAHRFTNVGARELAMTCIHAASKLQTEWVSARDSPRTPDMRIAAHTRPNLDSTSSSTVAVRAPSTAARSRRRRAPSNTDNSRSPDRAAGKEAMSATISKLANVIIPVADQDQAVEFYIEKLGLEKRVELVFGPDFRWIEVAPPRADTSIALCPPGPDVTPGGKQTGISLQAEDVDAYHAELKARGVDVDAEVARFGENVPPTFWLRDHEGNILQVVQET